MITDIKIQDGNYKCDGEIKLSGLKKINIFLGANNSGKSRFMRSLFSNELLGNTLTTIHERIKIEAIFEFYRDQFKKYKICSGDFINFNELYNQFISKCVSSPDVHFSRNLISQIKLGGLKEDFYDQYNFKKVYIPMLRGLRNPIQKEVKRDLYENRTIYDYFLDNKNKVQGIGDLGQMFYGKNDFMIFSGLSLYGDIQDMSLGTADEQEKKKDFENFLSINFFEKRNILLTANNKSDVLFIKIGADDERSIYDVGDGLQTIIINTFPLFKYKGEQLLLFIEEPEMTLHPGMQRKLLEVLLTSEYSKNVQVFMTTHSNHMLEILLDYEDDVATYSFKKESDDKYLIENKTKNKEILDLLGVRNSSVFLSNCIIWVEGISDRLYIKKFLELYYKNLAGKNYEEDKHYSIVEYGGGNITHFNFDELNNDGNTINIEAIQKNNFLVADNDLCKEGTTKYKRLQDLRKIMGKESIYSDFPEVENLITFDNYNDYFQDNSGINWELKKENLGTRESFDEKIYNTDIGVILKESFIGLKGKKENEKFTEGNDISIIGNKAKIAGKMIKYMKNYDDLGNKAKELTEKIHNFIARNNS